jgi:hypothetical protein
VRYQVSLASASAKLERAGIHRDVLDSDVAQAFSVETNRVLLGAEIDAETGYHLLRVESAPDLDSLLTQFGLTLGDALINLRSALDHLFWQLACFHVGGTPEKHWLVQFPIDDCRDTFRKRPVKNYIDPGHWAIIESHQPYHGLDGRPDSWSGTYAHQLALLRNLTNDDKHKITTPMLAISNRITLRRIEGLVWSGFDQLLAGQFPIQSHVEFLNLGEPAVVGAVVGRTRPTGRGAKPKLHNIGEVTPQIALPGRGAAIPALDRITERVALILNEFANLFPAA